MNKHIIAITGLPGSGKSEVAAYLEQLGYPVIRFGSVTEKALREQNLERTEENERKYREELRTKHGMAAFAIESYPAVAEQIHKGATIVIIDGLRSWEEYLYLTQKEPQILLLAVHASKHNRYLRLQMRFGRPQIPEISLQRDLAELKSLNMAPAILLADYFIENNGSMEELTGKIDAVLKNLKEEDEQG